MPFALLSFQTPFRAALGPRLNRACRLCPSLTRGAASFCNEETLLETKAPGFWQKLALPHLANCLSASEPRPCGFPAPERRSLRQAPTTGRCLRGPGILEAVVFWLLRPGLVHGERPGFGALQLPARAGKRAAERRLHRQDSGSPFGAPNLWPSGDQVKEPQASPPENPEANPKMRGFF